jgi:enoyl-CoA hydratase
VSLTCMPVTAEMAERWGLVNHVVDDNEVLSKAIEVAEAIVRNNRNLVVLYKSVINDGFKLDLEHAQALEKVRACTFCGTFYLHVNVFFLIKLSSLADLVW